MCLDVTLIACRYEYLWADGTEVKKPIKLSAPEYVDYLMTWVQKQLDDETVFPYHIPANAMLAVSLKAIKPILEQLSAFETAEMAENLAAEIDLAIKE